MRAGILAEPHASPTAITADALVVFMTGGPAPDADVEFPAMWFTDYTKTLVLEPKGGTTTLDFDVPRERTK